MLHSLLPLLLALLAPAPSADWPRWRGPDNTGRIPVGVAVPRSLPAEPAVAWHVPIGAGCGSPVVSGGRVFYLDNQDRRETVHAVEAATGKEVWRADLDEVFVDSQSSPGPRSTPVVDGDRVYVQSCRGEFQCLSAADGKRLWGVNFVKDFGAVFQGETGSAAGATRHGYTGSALIDGDRLLVGVGGQTGASVVCFDKRSGRVLWKSQSDVPGHSGPVLVTLAGVRQVVSFTAGGVMGLNARDGALLWRSPVETRLGRHVTTPVVVGDTVVVGSYTAGLMGIRVTREGGAFRAERAWLHQNLGVNFADMVAVGEHVYGLGGSYTLFCVHVPTGQVAWREDRFFSGGLARTGFAGFLVAGPNLLILADSGQALLVPADPKACRTLGKATVCGPNWCSPAYASGRLYLRDQQELRCVKLLP